MKSEAAFVRQLVILAFVGLVFFAGCGGGTSHSFNNQPMPPSGSHPTPTITTISPNSTVVGGAAFTLTINGVNFVAASMVNFGGSAPATTFVNSTQLTAAIPAPSIASTGTLAVTVTNPTPGGGTSIAVNFIISSGTNPIPTINSLGPSCAPAGSVDSLDSGLVVGGLNFVASSVVRWNGTDRPTTLDSNSLGRILTAQLSASDIAAAGTAAVTVFNPAPGGGSSNSSTFTITTGAVDPQSIAVDPTGKFAYVANTGCVGGVGGYVSMYTINATIGALVSIGPPVSSRDEGANSVAVDPFGKFAYVANTGGGDTGGSVSAYTINATTGALTSTGTIAAGTDPISVVVDPTGKFAYVTNSGSNNVSMYTINATTGVLTSTGTIAAGTDPISVIVDPTGKFAYVANSDSNNVSMYTINATTGALTSTGTIAAGTDPISVAVDPTGKFAYVTNSGSNDVSMYSIDAATGALTLMGTIGT